MRDAAGIDRAGGPETTVNVCETFASLQGESTYAGLTCFFVRLAGCNLRCVYCDTPQAFEPGREMSVDELARAASASGTAITEITGGEPLLQAGCAALAARLCEATRGPVLVETNGTCDISALPDRAVRIMDVKCPGSGAGASFDLDNLRRLRGCDEVKFVISHAADYEWARAFAARHALQARCAAVLFSPARGRLAPADLARWIMRDALPVRLQVPLHSVLGLR